MHQCYGDITIGRSVTAGALQGLWGAPQQVRQGVREAAEQPGAATRLHVYKSVVGKLENMSQRNGQGHVFVYFVGSVKWTGLQVK